MKVLLKSKRAKKNEKKVGKLKILFDGYKYEILIFLFFVLIRLPSLGHDNFNTDVWRWKARSYDFGNGLAQMEFDKTLQKYHPGVTLMWLGSAGVKINNIYANFKGQSLVADDDIRIVFQLDFIQKLLIVLTLGFTSSVIFYALKNIFSLKYALISIIILSLEPFYLGLTRVFHLEGLVSTFMLASVVWLYFYLLNTENKKRLVVSGMFAGFSLLTKTSALFLIPFFILTTFLHFYREGKSQKKRNSKWFLFIKDLWDKKMEIIKIFLLWFGVLILVFFAFWPALWVIPGRVFQTLYEGISSVGVEGDHIHYYFGKLVQDPGFSFYFVVLGFRSSIYLLIGFFGALFIRKKIPGDQRKFLDFLLIFVLFYFIQLIIPTKKLDRYILPVLGVMSLVSSFFILWVFEKIKFKNQEIKILSLVGFLLPLVFTNLYVHPDYLSYYNPMFGGIKTGVKILEPKWLIGTDEVIDYFKNIHREGNMEFSSSTSFEDLVYKAHGKNLQNVLSVGFREKYYSQIWPFFKEFGAWAIVSELAPFAERTKYFVYPVWDRGGYEETRFRVSYFDTIYVRGAPLYDVFKNEREGVHVR